MSTTEQPTEIKTKFFAVVFDQFPCHNEGEIKFVQHLQQFTRRVHSYHTIDALAKELDAMVPETMQFKAVHFYDKRIDSNVITFSCSNSAESNRTVAHFFPVKED